MRIHHPPMGELTVSMFDVSIDGIKTSPWYCRVSALPYNTAWPGHQRPIEQSEVASFISFEMDKPVELKLTAWKAFEEVVIRPLSRHIAHSVNGREITFTLDRPGSFTVELDGWHNALHIFANPETDFGVDKNAANVRYYAPGVYEVGDMELEDGETLFIDGGAVLYGSVNVFEKKNVRIVGYGIIDGSREQRTSATANVPVARKQTEEERRIHGDSVNIDLRDTDFLRGYLRKYHVLNGCIRMYSCQDCELNGVITRDASIYSYLLANCEHINCEWIKTIGMWRYNTDGFDLFNCRYINVANGFFRNFDDCIVLKGRKGWDRADQHHVTISGCVCWCDWGRCIELGAETCADEFYYINISDCDCIHTTDIHLDIQNGDRAHIHDVVFENIRCEYSKYDMLPVYQQDMTAPYTDHATPHQPKLIESVVYNYGGFQGQWVQDDILGQTSDIIFKNICVYGPENMAPPVCNFNGTDANHCNHNIVIENISVNGRRLPPEEIALIKSESDSNITVK